MADDTTRTELLVELEVFPLCFVDIYCYDISSNLNNQQASKKTAYFFYFFKFFFVFFNFSFFIFFNLYVFYLFYLFFRFVYFFIFLYFLLLLIYSQPQKKQTAPVSPSRSGWVTHS
ncbi:hypothetical protein HanIR_Chr08g0342511 [Helianthus annuus]|nr:hypothetical protein HanIR_Chr08g0342511 [Helianthus annuus]